MNPSCSYGTACFHQSRSKEMRPLGSTYPDVLSAELKQNAMPAKQKLQDLVLCIEYDSIYESLSGVVLEGYNTFIMSDIINQRVRGIVIREKGLSEVCTI